MQNRFNPLITVIIPAYNSEKYIGEAINSVLSQTYTNFELLIVDDNSTDSTFEIINNFAKKDKRIKVHQIEHSGRPAVPRNVGIKLAAGEYISFIDNDDKWEKHKLEEQIAYFENETELSMVYSMSVTFGNVNLFSPGYEVLPLLFKAAHNREELINKGNSVTLSTVMARKIKLVEVGFFDEDPLNICDDYDMWIRLAEAGKIIFIPKIHCYYRVHKNQLSSDWETKKERLKYFANKRNLKLPKYNFYRNKGPLFLIARNSLHFFTYLWVTLQTSISRVFR